MTCRRTPAARFAVLTLVAALMTLAAPAQAFQILGTGTASLVDNDLTDLGDDGVEGSYAPPNLAGFDAEFFANYEAAFGGGEYSFNIFDNRVGGGSDKACCGGIPIIIGADFSNTQATGGLLIRLDRFTLASSNDSSQRDPDRWSIQGSTDTTTGLDGTWTNIYAKTAGGADWGGTRNEVIAYGAVDGDTFLSTAGFTAFRLNATASGTGTDFALGEMELFGTVFFPTTPGVPLFWDGSAGNWTNPVWLSDVPGVGAPTGTYPQNIATVVNPANITEGTVSVNSNEEAYSLTMDTGTNGSGGRPGNGILNITSNTLSINTAATISNTSAVNISPGATFDVSGTLQIDSTAPLAFDVSGIAKAKTLAGTGTATLNNLSTLTAGGGSLGAIVLTGNAEIEANGDITVGLLTLPTNTTLTKSGTGTLDVLGATTLLTGQLYTPTAGVLKLSGVVSGGVDLIKNGAGALHLANNNDYTGVTTINAGRLLVSSNDALGAPGADTTVNNGGQLALTGNITLNAGETITINGGGPGNGGALYVQTGGTNEIAGLVQTGSNSRIHVAAGASARLKLTGGLALNHQVIAALDGSGERLEIDTVGLSGAGELRKEGDGRIEVKIADAGYTGQVRVTNGYVEAWVTDALGSGQIIAEGDGTLLLRNGVTMSNNFVLTTDGEGTNGAIRNENSTNTITGTVTSNNNNTRIRANGGQLNLENTLQLNNNVRIDGNGTLNVTGQITGGGQFNKFDGGTTILDNPTSNFTGATNINGGTVDAVAGALSNSSTVTVGPGSTLNIAGGGLNNLVVNGDATTSADLALNNLTVNSTSLQAGANLVNVSNSMQLGGAAYAINSGTIDVSGTISKNKPDALILNAANVTVTTPQVPSGQPTNGLIGMWTFDNGAAPDLTGNGHDGIFVGSPTISNADLYDPGAGMSLNTNGGNNAILIGGNEADFDTGDELSVVFWAKERPDGGWEPYISKRGESNGWQVRRRGNSSNLSYTLRGTSGTDDPQGTFNIGDNNGNPTGWFHVVARYDGTTLDLRQLIVNGNTASPDISITDTGNIGNTGSSVVFGARDNSNNAGNPANIGNWAHIKLDDVFIYDRWLTDAEVTTLYNGGVALPRVTGPSFLVGGLAGTGTIDVTGTGGMEIDAGGFIAPGDSPGILSIDGDLTAQDGLTYRWGLGASGYDSVDVTGGLTLGDWVLQVYDDGGIGYPGEKFYVFTGYSSLTMTGTPVIDLSTAPNWEQWSALYGNPQIAVDTGGVYLTGLVAIPEPATLTLLGLGLLAARRRRRKR